MSEQFQLGSKHLEYKKNAQTIISEININDTKIAIKELLQKSYGLLPSSEAAYNDYLGLTLIVEEISKTAPKVAALMIEQIVAQEIFKNYASNIKIDSSKIYSILCSEPGINGLASLKTKAVKAQSGWNIEGKKTVSSEQALADEFLVFAKDEEEKIRIFSISNINVSVVNKQIAGANVALSQAEIKAEVPESACIAIINDSGENSQTVARTLIAALSIGVAHSSLVSAIGAAKETKGADNLAISNTQSIQFTLADMFAEVEAARMLTYYSADLIDNNSPNVKYATMAKVQATESASHVSVQALEIIGNLGFLANNDYADIFQSAINAQIKGGTNRVQRNQIYKYMMAKK